MSLRIPDSPRFIDPMLVRAMRENRDAWRRLLERVPMLGGQLVEYTDGLGSAGQFTISHSLGRQPRGFFVVDVVRASGSSGGMVFYSRRDDVRSASQLELTANNSFDSVKIWVW